MNGVAAAFVKEEVGRPGRRMRASVCVLAVALPLPSSMAQERQASFFAGAAARLQYRVSMGEVSRSDATEDNGAVRLPAFEPVAVPELLIEHGAVDAESGDGIPRGVGILTANAVNGRD